MKNYIKGLQHRKVESHQFRENNFLLLNPNRALILILSGLQHNKEEKIYFSSQISIHGYSPCHPGFFWGGGGATHHMVLGKGMRRWPGLQHPFQVHTLNDLTPFHQTPPTNDPLTLNSTIVGWPSILNLGLYATFQRKPQQYTQCVIRRGIDRCISEITAPVIDYSSYMLVFLFLHLQISSLTVRGLLSMISMRLPIFVLS